MDDRVIRGIQLIHNSSIQAIRSGLLQLQLQLEASDLIHVTYIV